MASSTIFNLGAPADLERPDKIIVTLKTTNQLSELIARCKAELERMEVENVPGQIVLVGRKR